MKVVLIGRPNVGKSTLFNRLVGKKLAIVNDIAGVTRDWKEGMYCVQDDVHIIDTPGVVLHPKDELERLMNSQSQSAFMSSDIVLFVVDGVTGVSASDVDVADWLRKQFKKHSPKVYVLANKCDCKEMSHGFERLGFGEAIYISAEHNLNLSEVHNLLSNHSAEMIAHKAERAEDTNDVDEQIKICIVGQPNVGKSTLMNHLLGYDRVIVGDIAGLTRDAISSDFIHRGRRIVVTDTAGQRRASKIDALEKISNLDSWRYIKQSHVVILLVDITVGLVKQDLTIARKVIDEGKVLLIVLSKADLCNEIQSAVKCISDELQYSLHQVAGVSVVAISSLYQKNIAKMLDVVVERYNSWSHRISTGALNRWLISVLNEKQPPRSLGRVVKIKYISQTNVKPATFMVFANVSEIAESYIRYLINCLRRDFHMFGVPIRIFVRSADNPYTV